ncbi:hypothetical protein BCV72DRAFT_219689 [Rhizopus microsporus var. microsporus]|uniref:Uncharacterized protein n=2 Tax=Rhizopus microsporus TaxID=58291 RepID=A0A1X0RHX5_RHIZD|nr:hypothetical protein BCV72DRAFT_219689 [Rhizopus microsporus var. microsporus]
MSSQPIKAYSKLKIDKPKPSFLSWIFHHNTDNEDSNKLETEDYEEETKERKHKLLISALPEHTDTQLSLSPSPVSFQECSFESRIPQYSASHNGSSSEIKIPSRHQSRYYSQIYGNNPLPSADVVNKTIQTDYKRRSCSARLSPNIDVNGSSLTRSASWQPSSQNQSGNNDPKHVLYSIPDRRTSRNYSQDPNIQAKLNEMLNNERTQLISQIIQHRK